ncbi:MDR family MFS transporter [Secundilactobacillus malefermentans]|uniref:MDR family MFS transporter n=1 Tax=Secundilactobacillus malefermentans TaxID=176292 RepID=UPI000527FB86|nr:MDR family MFS transporter [Secundilactobacillus malefermentans]KRM60021.1 major facilitator superfamily permease [Secundilactobacillus malefermentans DSM 5705 = KCTC 3548]QEA30795.1 MFS transporter [Secundilactobacillus malefermentans]
MKHGGEILEKKSNVVIVTIAVFVASFMSAIEGTIVSTAMPTIVGDLHGVSIMNWIFSIYLLTNAIATPIYGKLSDTIGRKKVLVFGLSVFIIGSTLSGLSESMGTLIMWRAVQGIGAGAIMPVTFTIIADIYPFEKRAKVLGFNGASWGIASIVAPLIGGFIVDQLTWHWIFFINVPIGIIVIALIIIFHHETFVPRKTKMDYQGSLWLSVTLLAIMYIFQMLSETTINWFMVVGTFVLAIITGYLFIRREKRVSYPIIPLELFKDRTFVTQNLVAALISGYLIGFDVYIPMWAQGIKGLPATIAGFALAPSSIMWMVGSFIAGKLLLSLTPKRVVMISLTIILIGSAIFALFPYSTGFGWFYLVAAICGTGFGITITTTTVTVQNEVSAKDIGIATSLNTLSRTLGQTLMVSVFGIVLNVTMAKGVNSHQSTSMSMMNKLINPKTATDLQEKLLPILRHILYQGIHYVFILGVCLILIAFVTNWFDRPEIKQDKLE